MNQILEQLEINNTFFIQFGLFAFFFVALSQVYLKPFQRLIEKRNRKLKDEVEGSAELLKSIDTKLAEFDKTLSVARTEAIQKFEAALQAVRAREDQEVTRVRDELKKDYLKAVHELEEEKLKIESELKLQLNQVTDVVVQKILVGN